MSKNVDHTGERFGSLVAVQRIPNYLRSQTYYKCICDCGNETIVFASNLTNGHTTSCGCYRKNKLANELKKYAGETFGNLTIIDAFIGNEPMFICSCSCGEEVTTSVKNVLSGKASACKKCVPMTQPKLRKDITGQKFGKLTVVEMLYRYRKTHTYCRCVCECGKETIVYLGNLSRGNTTSCGCVGNSARYNADHSNDLTGLRIGKLTFIEQTDKKESNGAVIWKCQCDCGNIVLTSKSNLRCTSSCGCEYEHGIRLDLSGKKFGALTALRMLKSRNLNSAWWECACVCGNTVKVRSNDLVLGRRSSCGCGTRSAFEESVAQVLDEYGVLYEREKTFKDCKHIGRLRFDFYVESHNLLIEADGEQHLRPVSKFGGDASFADNVIRDSIKNQYCKSNNINLLRINYTRNIQDIQQQIKNYIDPVTITA